VAEPTPQVNNPLARRKGRWLRPFLDALADSGNVTYACARARVSRVAVYKRRRRHPAFATLWDDALEVAADLLELEARRRAKDGVPVPVLYQGKVCGQWLDERGRPVPEGTPGATLVPLVMRKYSDRLLAQMLAAKRPQEYGRQVRHRHEHNHEHRHDGTVRLSYDELRKLPLDELVRIHRETLGPPGAN
jgi:hypothetical protein